MGRKAWIIVGAVLAGLIVLGAATVGGVYGYIEYRNRGWLRDALAAYEKGEWARAKGFLERYIPQDPRNGDLLQKYTDACTRLTTDRSGSLRAAATAYQQILTYHPERIDVRAPLIGLYTKLSAWSTIESYTRDWLRRTPGDADLLYYNALALDRMGKPDEAIAGYEALIAQGTDRSDVYGSYARLLRDKGLEQKAVEVFATARAARPDDGRIIADHARFLARRATWAEVQALLDEALALSPRDADVLVAAAQADMLRRQHVHAVELLKRAIEADPDEGAAYLMIASVYLYQGLTEEAIKALRQTGPFVRADNPMVLITLADLQLSMSAFDDAKETIAEYVGAYPDQLPINEYFTAKEMLVRGEASEAVKRLASVTQLRPGFALAQYTLAEAYLATGESELARHALESYLAKNSSDERAQRLMAQRFGRPVSLDALAARAEDLVKEKAPNTQRVLTIAGALLDTALRNDTLDDYGELVRSTVEKAIAAEPAAPAPYKILADLALLRGQPDEAVAAVDRAEAQGCDATEFLLVRTGAALAKGETAAANAVLEDAVSRPGFGYTDYAEWAASFARHGRYDQALATLDRGIQKAGEGEAQATLEVERILLQLRHGDLAETERQIEAVAPQVAPGTTLRRRLNAARLQLAQAYLAADPSQKAEQDAQKLVHAVRTEDPGNPALQVTDGLLLMRATPPELGRAQALFENAAAADATSVGAQWGLAKVALARSDFPRALTHIQRALSVAPNVPALRLIEANALIETDRLFEAERTIRRLIAQRPDDPAAAQLLAVCLVRRGALQDATAAVDRFEKLAADDPSYVDSLRALRASLLVENGNDAEAERTLRAEFESRPDDIEIAIHLAGAVLRQGREDDAKELLLDFAENHRGDPAVWVAIAQWWTRPDTDSGWREASTCLTRALLVDPDYVPAIRAMLAIRLRQRDDLEALGLCDRYLARNPDDAETLNTKAGLLVRINGRQQEALAAVDRAIELDDRIEYKGTRGVVLVAMQQYERALRDLRPYAIETKELTAQYDAALAEAYFATSEFRLARKHLDSARAKAADGDHADADRLRQLDEALRRKESAA